MEQKIFNNPEIPAFIKASQKTIKVVPHRNVTGTVVFIVEGDKKIIEEAITEFYGNASIGILDFIKEFKELRSSIYVLRENPHG